MKLRQKKLLVSLACLLSLLLLAGSASALVVNGDFELGDTGFFSAYFDKTTLTPSNAPGPASTLWDEGTYAVGTNPALYHNLWGPGFPAHGGSGNMMIINGATDANITVWREAGLGPVTVGTKYYFSVWIASIYAISPADLSFSINSTQIGSPILASSTVGLWQQFYVEWTADTTTVDLAAINLNTTAGGNDFCLDDIVFDTNPVPLPPTALLLGTGLLGLVGLGYRRSRKS